MGGVQLEVALVRRLCADRIEKGATSSVYEPAFLPRRADVVQ